MKVEERGFVFDWGFIGEKRCVGPQGSTGQIQTEMLVA